MIKKRNPGEYNNNGDDISHPCWLFIEHSQYLRSWADLGDVSTSEFHRDQRT